MSYFPLVSTILSELDRQGWNTKGEDWDKSVAEAILGFNASFGGRKLLERNRKLIDYSDLTTQAAYVFMYVACHADILHQVLVKGQTVGAFDCLAKDEIQVTSLGGGPGSDLLALVGLIRSLRPDERPKRIKYRVLDKQPNWHEILKAVAVGQRGTVDIDVSFQQVDVTVPDEWKNITCVNDNLLIMNFFVSEVCVLREAQSVRQCLENLLGTVSGGATVVFNDSKFPSCYDYFDARVAAANGFARLVVESSRLDATTDFDEFFRECMVRFDRTPKLGSNAAYRVLKKQ